MGTALITGASAGLGEEFAWHLATAGHDLVLVARNEQRLNTLAAEMSQAAGVGVQVLAADLSTPEGLERVTERLRTGTALGERDQLASGGAPCETVPHTAEDVAGRCVDLLVNNAGFAVGQAFVGGDLEQELRALEVMVRAVLVLTHAAVPGMVERGHGAVLNVSSMVALTAMGTYAAHKAWVRTFTEALASELHGTGVTATSVHPGLTRTEFHERAGMSEENWPDLVWLEAEQVVEEALAAVRRGQVLCTPSLRYRSANAALRMAPRWIVRRVSGHGSQRTQY
ncbi:SDR family NAD(P)-dependent oxidoreductase [Actinomyces trachealis]|uniref:SDR family NAD(P)-dependent oxidoreductase n=1 Tax=Actinomyces trachealis TaxID=2763540 RepID=UPI001892AF8D|nr:SDR family oxidoreductase [Actinomyces trachealis]